MRGIAIVLVLLHHAIDLSAMFSGVAPPDALVLVDEAALPYRMPLLVFLSGLVLNRSLGKPLATYYLGKVRGILWPYLVWVVVYGLVVDVRQLGSWNVWAAGTWLWYLAYIMVFYSIAPVVRRLPAWVVPTAFWLGSVLVPSAHWTQFFFLGAFFFAGNLAWRERTRLAALDTPLWRAIAIAFALGYAGFFVAQIHIEAVPVVFGQYDPFAAPLVLVALSGLISLVRLIPDTWTGVTRYLGRHSLVFYVSHFPFQIVWTTWLASMYLWDWRLHIVGGVLGALCIGIVLQSLRRVNIVDWLFVMPGRSLPERRSVRSRDRRAP